jgi:hypothetical protein
MRVRIIFLRYADEVNNSIRVFNIFIYIIINIFNTTQRYQHPLMNVLYLDNLCFLFMNL